MNYPNRTAARITVSKKDKEDKHYRVSESSLERFHNMIEKADSYDKSQGFMCDYVYGLNSPKFGMVHYSITYPRR